MFLDRVIKPVLAVGASVALVAWPALAWSADATNAAASAPASSKTTDLFPDTVVAKGKGVEIKRSQLDDEVIHIKSQAAARGTPVPPERSLVVEQQVLDEMIQRQLVKSRATEAEQAAARKAAEKQLEEAKTQLGSDDALDLRLKAVGLTRQEMLNRWAEGEELKLVLVRELNINITDDEIKKFYDDNPAQFEEPEKVRASHILLSTKDMTTQVELSDEKKAAKKKLAEDLVKRARGGEDFAKLAKQYSEDPGSKDTGGEYTFPRGRMVKEFEDAAFTLKTNEVSDVVTTQFGYHVIKLSEKIPAKKHDFAESSPKIKDYLTQMALQKQAPDYLKKLRADANVQILDEKLKPSETTNSSPATGRTPSAAPPGGTGKP